MDKQSKQIAGFILGAAAGVALYKYYSMPREKRKEFWEAVKNTTDELLDNADETVEKVEHYVSEIQSRGKGEWIDKLYILKKMVKALYGSERNDLM
jgi:phage-related protein